jgi:hypothetical protein
MVTTSNFPNYYTEYALNTPHLHHVGHSSDLYTSHKCQNFTLQRSKANYSVHLEIKTKCSERTEQNIPVISLPAYLP